ncbi:MAG: response regulator [Candidatus Dormibacteria bacterium]
MARILIVDDEPDIRFIARMYFERAGYEVAEAPNGAAALIAILEMPPDLLVTDMMMPMMNGAELIRRLRADPSTAGIPILAVTGDPSIAAEADKVLEKGVPQADIVAAAAALLNTGV